MKRISKDDSKRKAEIVERLTVAENKFETAIQAFNGIVNGAWVDLEAAQTEYSETVQEANSFREDIASEIESYIDERSDKWREGDAAGSYETWRDQWQEEFEEISLDAPDEIAMELEASAADLLRDLEEEVSL